MGKYTCALFDLDGVIVDTAKYHFLAWKALANKLGFDFTEEDNELLKGVSRVASLEILLRLGNVTLTEDEKLQYMDEKNALYLEYIKQLTSDDILPGAHSFLVKLRDKGIKIGLGSASKNAVLILGNLGIETLFDCIIDGNKVSKAKPDPEVFLLGAETLGVKPAYCVVFEDAIAGITAAKKADMYAVGIGQSDTLLEADLVVNNLSELSIEEIF